MSYTIGDPDDNSTVINQTTSGTYTISPGGLSGSGGTGQLYWGLNGTSNTCLSINPSLKGSQLKVNGDAEFDGEVTIKGKSLTDMFEKIEERLSILHPNPKLEDKWDELKELGKRYKELEAEIIEKEKVWAILKR